VLAGLAKDVHRIEGPPSRSYQTSVRREPSIHPMRPIPSGARPFPRSAIRGDWGRHQQPGEFDPTVSVPIFKGEHWQAGRINPVPFCRRSCPGFQSLGGINDLLAGLGVNPTSGLGISPKITEQEEAPAVVVTDPAGGKGEAVEKSIRSPKMPPTTVPSKTGRGSMVPTFFPFERANRCYN